MGINEKSMPLPKPKTKKAEAELRRFYDGPFYDFGPNGWEPDEPHLASGKESSAIIITITFFFILLLSFLWLAACGIMHLVMCGG